MTQYPGPNRRGSQAYGKQLPEKGASIQLGISTTCKPTHTSRLYAYAKHSKRYSKAERCRCKPVQAHGTSQPHIKSNSVRRDSYTWDNQPLSSLGTRQQLCAMQESCRAETTLTPHTNQMGQLTIPTYTDVVNSVGCQRLGDMTRCREDGSAHGARCFDHCGSPPAATALIEERLLYTERQRKGRWHAVRRKPIKPSSTTPTTC